VMFEQDTDDGIEFGALFGSNKGICIVVS
ncbi:hypothetical protein ICW_05681, partial [Bacillus wiedmannii]